MKTRVVRIGNSRGVRIPKPLLEQAGLPDEVELAVEDSTIVIRPSVRPRDGWSEQFEAMAEAGDDELLDPDALSTSPWDGEEWEW